MKTFIEEDCTITHEGKKYTSGGSFILLCSDGKYRGVVYITNELSVHGSRGWLSGYKNIGYADVTDWHGNKIARCSYTDYQGNFCTMRRISFELDGRKFVGDYCPNWKNACKVRSTK